MVAVDVLTYPVVGVKGSGKSTILQQIRKGCEPESSSPLHSLAFSFGERQEYRRIIYENVIDSFILTLDHMQRYDLRFNSAASHVSNTSDIAKNGAQYLAGPCTHLETKFEGLP